MIGGCFAGRTSDQSSKVGQQMGIHSFGVAMAMLAFCFPADKKIIRRAMPAPQYQKEAWCSRNAMQKRTEPNKYEKRNGTLTTEEREALELQTKAAAKVRSNCCSLVSAVLQAKLEAKRRARQLVQCEQSTSEQLLTLRAKLNEIEAVASKLRTKGRTSEAQEAAASGNCVSDQINSLESDLKLLQAGVLPGEQAPAEASPPRKPRTTGRLGGLCGGGLTELPAQVPDEPNALHVWRSFEFGGLKFGAWSLPCADETGNTLDGRLSTVMEVCSAECCGWLLCLVAVTGCCGWLLCLVAVPGCCAWLS